MSIQEGQLPLACFQHWVQERGDDVYLTQPLGGETVRDFTWKQADDEARRMAAHLNAQGWAPGSRVAILSRNCAWWFLAEYAIWMAGHVSVPIYPSLTGDSVRYILEHAEARALFLGPLDSEDWASMRAGIPAGVTVIRFPNTVVADLSGPVLDWDHIATSTAPMAGAVERGRDEIATIIYTSGTTGTPKGVMHSFGTVAASMWMLSQAYAFHPGDRFLSYLPLAHAADRMCSEMASLVGGARVWFSEGTETFAADLKRARPTFFISVPRLWTKFRQAVEARLPQAQLAALLADPERANAVREQVLSQIGLQHTRLALCGAAPLPPDLHRWYLDLGLELLEVYGMTENLGVSHGSRPGKGQVGSVGQNRPGVEVRRDDSGEILVRGAGNMLGYFKDPARTAEAVTVDGFLRTGDLGEVDGEGYLRLTGRLKELFKTAKGKFVAPAPIENALGAHPLIEASCVTGVGFPQPFALILLASGTKDLDSTRAELDTLRRSVNERLDPHERLDFLAVVSDAWTVDNGFLTPTFKIKRAVIEKHYGDRFDGWAKRRDPVLWG